MAVAMRQLVVAPSTANRDCLQPRCETNRYPRRFDDALGPDPLCGDRHRYWVGPVGSWGGPAAVIVFLWIIGGLYAGLGTMALLDLAGLWPPSTRFRWRR